VICNARREILTNGAYIFKNELGGRILGIPYILSNRLNVGFLSYFRQEMIQSGVKWLCNGLSNDVLFVKREPYIFPVRIEFEDKSIMCLFNLNSDLLDSVILEVGELDTLVAQALREYGS